MELNLSKIFYRTVLLSILFLVMIVWILAISYVLTNLFYCLRLGLFK